MIETKSRDTSTKDGTALIAEETLEQAILWSYRLKDEPFDPETQRQYDEFCRRCERSKLGRLFKEAGSRRAPESAPWLASNHSGSTTAAIAAAVEPAVTAPEPAPVSRAEPVFEEYGPNGLVKAVPGMRLDVLMALQSK
jgi:hypothetical protein